MRGKKKKNGCIIRIHHTTHSAVYGLCFLSSMYNNDEAMFLGKCHLLTDHSYDRLFSSTITQ